MIKSKLGDLFFFNSLINPDAVLFVIDFNCHTFYYSLNVGKNNITFQSLRKYKNKIKEWKLYSCK